MIRMWKPLFTGKAVEAGAVATLFPSESIQSCLQGMVDWGAFVLSDASKTGLDALTGTGSRGLSLGERSGGAGPGDTFRSGIDRASRRWVWGLWKERENGTAWGDRGRH